MNKPRTPPQILSGVAPLALALIVLVPAARGDDFRVESKVYAGKDDKPTSESVSLFHEGLVYDFLSSPREITLLDADRGRIVVLDPARKLRTELTTDRLNKFAEQLRQRALSQNDPLLKFAADPKFEIVRDEEGRLRLASDQIVYRVRTLKVDDPDVARAYREFADWSAKLNAMMHPGALPPFARLEVNAALEKEGDLPEQVEVKISPRSRLGGRSTAMHSEHEATLGLTTSDLRQIEEAQELLVSFKAVSLEDYLRPLEQAKR